MARKTADDKKEGDEGGDYAFAIPEFDEAAFREKDLVASRITFAVVGLSLVFGILAWLITLPDSVDWKVGWIPLLLAIPAVKPTLARLGYPEEQLTFRSLWGNYFLIFFSALAVWTLLLNVYAG